MMNNLTSMYEKCMDLQCMHIHDYPYSFASGILDVRKLLNMGIRIGLGLGKDTLMLHRLFFIPVNLSFPSS